MGAVYEGVQAETGKRFAIKVLSPALAAAPAAHARFLKEAQLTARVRHANIVEVTDVGEDAGKSYFVMELLEGEDLSQRLRRAGPLSAAEAADMMRPVCNAVAEAHRRGITHRDLKPSNIFLAVREGRSHPVVLDFGIAKDGEGANPGDAAGAVAAKGGVLGTPYYLAPEQVADHQAATAASDQHALGVILYECLTGTPPYGGDSLDEVLRAIVAGNPAPPSTRRSELPASLDTVVRRALNSDPKRRFASVAELGLALYPFASKSVGKSVQKSGGAAPEPYRRPPTSPAIDVEASTPSPFVRTLTPEVEALDGAWFAAGETPQEITGEVMIPPKLEADAAGDAASPLPTDLPDELETPAKGRGKRAVRRLWIGAAGGVALASLALVLVVTRGSASGPPGPQAMPTPAAQALVQSAPARAVVEEPPVEPMPAPAAIRPPAAAASSSAAPAAAPSEPPAPVAPAPAPSKALAATAPAAAPGELPAAPTEVPMPAPSPLPAAAPSEPPTPVAPVPAPSKALAATAPVPVPVPSEPPTVAPSDPAAPGEVSAAAEKSRARKSADKPRARSGSVRMHNGVPLLD